MSLLPQYGVLGILAAILIVYAKGTVAREREKTDRAEARVEELNQFIRNELLPKQVESTIVHKQVTDALTDAVQVISELNRREQAREHRERQ